MKKHVCVLACAIGALISFGSALTQAQVDPSTLPLLQFGDLIYAGAFRLPGDTVNGDSFSIGGRPFSYNPARNSLFVGTRSGRVAEVTIPTPVSTNNVTALPFASFLQGFVEPTEGNLWRVAASDAAIDGMLVYGDRIYGTASIYYDANNTQRVSHYSRSTNLSAQSFVGMSSVWQADHSGFVSGYMAVVPAEWQSRLGGPAITGQCCLPIAWRTSWGPSAFAWNPAHLGQVNPIPATPLLYYPSDHHTLGHWDGANATYGGTTQINGVALVAGTRTALYFGRNGTGPFCYGNGTSNPALTGTTGPDGEIYCYDPSYPAKGQHAYPYNYQIWAYDLNDLAAVRAGTRQPWDVRPYGVWPFSFPISEPQVRIGGVAYDSARQLIYVSQLLADQDGYGYRPLIHVLRIGGAPGTPLPGPDAVPPPPSTGSGRTTSITIAPDRASPQPPGTTITWTATPVGGVSPHQYKWWTYDGSTWTAVTGWTTSRTYAWTPTVANTRARVAVWVRSHGNNVDDQETSVAADYPISGTGTSVPPPPTGGTGKVGAVTLTPDRPAPQAAGSTITFTAAPVGGVSPHQYKWWIFDGTSWLVQGTWTTSSTFQWTPASANSRFRIAVWARSHGNSVDDQEASVAVDYPITSGSSSPAPAPSPSPAPSTTVRSTSVSIAANRVAPQPPGTTITWSATPVGGSTPYQYKWWVFDGSLWTPLGGWTTSSTHAWTPSTASADYRIGVWVRSNGNAIDEPESSSSEPFAISGGAAAPPPASSSTRVAAVTIGANRVAPQPPGVTTTFTALPSGGTAPLQYKWWIFDGTLWVQQGGWTTSSTFTWTPAAPNVNYRIGVWVRSAGNATDAGEATVAIPFPIQ